jgi:hypothetical protein
MPNLAESLQGRDLGHLRIIAELWGIELDEQVIPMVLLHLIPSLLSVANVGKMVHSLDPDAKAALNDLSQHAGRIPWAQFTRLHGEIREMGPAKRDREQPYKQATSAVETLWYRALIARAFFDAPAGVEEFAYIPDDLLVLIPQSSGMDDTPLMGRQASATEYTQIFLVNDWILDHACTQLAAMRLGIKLPDAFPSSPGEELSTNFMNFLLSATGLLDEAGNPLPEPVRIALEAMRGQALLAIFQSWQQSSLINELRLLPNFIMEGNWKNDPLRARQTVIGYLSSISAETWWSLGSFVAAIKQRNPDFQRPAGDYDSWFIRDKSSGEYLRGFDHWEDVDGRLIRYILTGPLHWLGVLDLACPENEQEITAFRLSAWSRALLRGEPPHKMPVEKEPLAVRSDARIGARRLVPRRVRYQLARFCEWEKETPEEYQYRISSASLAQAHQQGLKVSQLLSLLNRYAKTMPPSLVKALERWDKNGSEARLEQMVVLRVASVEVLQALRKSRANRFLGEPLGPTTIAVKAGAIDKVLGALAELGYLGEIRGVLEAS